MYEGGKGIVPHASNNVVLTFFLFFIEAWNNVILPKTCHFI
jgi:hypothetical protein